MRNRLFMTGAVDNIDYALVLQQQRIHFTALAFDLAASFTSVASLEGGVVVINQTTHTNRPVALLLKVHKCATSCLENHTVRALHDPLKKINACKPLHGLERNHPENSDPICNHCTVTFVPRQCTHGGHDQTCNDCCLSSCSTCQPRSCPCSCC